MNAAGEAEKETAACAAVNLRSAGAKEADHDALDGELGDRKKVRVTRILRAKEGAAALDEETLECGLAVDQGRDDVLRAGFAGSEEDNIIFDYVGADHGITANAQGEKIGVGAEAEGGGIDGDCALGLLFVGGRETGGNYAVERDAEQRGVAGMVAGMEEAAGFAGEAVERTFFREGIDVALDSEGTRETEMFLDFAEHWSDAMFALVSLDKIEDLLLTFGEGFGHGVFN